MEFSASECLWSIYLVTVLILIMLLKLCAGIFSIPVMPLLLPSWTDAVMLRCNHHLLFFLVIYKRNKWHVCGSPLSKSSVLSHINVIRTNEHMHVACVQIFALVLFCHHFWYIMKLKEPGTGNLLIIWCMYLHNITLQLKNISVWFSFPFSFI